MDLLRQELQVQLDQIVDSGLVVVFHNESLDPHTTPSMVWLDGVARRLGIRSPSALGAMQLAGHLCLQSRTSLW